MRPISFLSDFGLSDEFAGVVHGVIARIAPEVQVIDITHGIAAGDVRGGALALSRAIQYLPEGVVLAIVDPGVGTDRAAVAVQTNWGQFVGPDNGVLSPAVALVGGASEAVSIENSEFIIPGVGATFEGRDRFAPAAAVLASNQASLTDLGPAIDPAELTPLMLPLPEAGDSAVQGEVWWIDHFGNAQTNVGPDELAAVELSIGGDVEVTVGTITHVVPWVASYAEVEPGEAMLIVDSSGLAAISVREGNAADQMGLLMRSAVSFKRP